MEVEHVVVTLNPEFTPAVMICSLMGTTLYIITEENTNPLRKLVTAIISFLCGVYGAADAAGAISATFSALITQFITAGYDIQISTAIGAMVASVTSVSLLSGILSIIRKKTTGDKG
ncbi:putative holin [Enterobacter sp. Bisph1]|uniref:putative holin n=1 Tax=Enterobacter sp. Bisph1 TaxID=1274399 RepID=UPI00068B0165|nr:putative holin [Enterobacter sp. Bisph1]